MCSIIFRYIISEKVPHSPPSKNNIFSPFFLYSIKNSSKKFYIYQHHKYRQNLMSFKLILLLVCAISMVYSGKLFIKIANLHHKILKISYSLYIILIIEGNLFFNFYLIEDSKSFLLLLLLQAISLFMWILKKVMINLDQDQKVLPLRLLIMLWKIYPLRIPLKLI